MLCAFAASVGHTSAHAEVYPRPLLRHQQFDKCHFFCRTAWHWRANICEEVQHHRYFPTSSKPHNEAGAVPEQDTTSGVYPKDGHGQLRFCAQRFLSAFLCLPIWQSRILGSNWRNLTRSGGHLVVQEEVKRESLGAIPYGPDEHKLNPYIGGNLQAINEFIKRDSELAAFYKQEAEPVSLPLFGPNRNLTVEGRLYRDPHAASVLKISRANEIGSGLRVPETDAASQATWTVRRLPATTPQWGFLVKIKTATPWAKLRYTLDGSPPTPPNNGIVLQPPVPWGPWHVTITPPTTSKARAYKKCFRDLYVASRTYP
jgi:hypothetical protein